MEPPVPPTRPLFRLGIAQLEAVYQLHGTDVEALRKLEDELVHRNLPRAHALLKEVRKARSALTGAVRRAPEHPPASPPAATPPRPVAPSSPPTLSIPKFVTAPPTTATPAAFEGATSRTADRAPAPSTFPTKKAEAEPSAGAFEAGATSHTLEQACKLLHIALSAAWPEVELARYRIVQRSSPEATTTMVMQQRQALLAEAKCANDAYASLAAERGRT